MERTTRPKGADRARYYCMEKNDGTDEVHIYIFGDITSGSGWFYEESDVSSYSLAKEIEAIPEGCRITVHINSYGGEVKEALGIYNVLKGRDVTTICEGFAASAASVIFCAGKERIMKPASLLFIHQAWTQITGNADKMEKTAADLRIITAATEAAYREAGVSVSDEELSAMMKEETWIKPDSAVAYGFATSVAEKTEDTDRAENSAMLSVMAAVTKADPIEEQIRKLEAAAEKMIATVPAPGPEQVGHRGFFNLAQLEAPARREK